MKRKQCLRCKRTKGISNFSPNKAKKDNLNIYCNSCLGEKNLRNRYNITRTQYNKMLKDQNHVCAICSIKTKGRLHVDHEHTTSAIRGLLCSPCNTSLGSFKDDIELLSRAVIYLHRSNKGVA